MTTPGEPTIHGISAITLATSDMARAVAFYKALGLVLSHGGPNAALSSFHVGSTALNLTAETPDHRAAFWGRIIFHVDDVDAWHARVVALGLRPDSQPADASWGERYFHLTGPDGHQLSFARPIADDR